MKLKTVFIGQPCIICMTYIEKDNKMYQIHDPNTQFCVAYICMNCHENKNVV